MNYVFELSDLERALEKLDALRVRNGLAGVPHKMFIDETGDWHIQFDNGAQAVVEFREGAGDYVISADVAVSLPPPEDEQKPDA